MLKAALTLILGLASLACIGSVAAHQFPLIPRNTLLGNPERASPLISPNGKLLAFLAPLGGVMNVYVAPVSDIAAAKPVTGERSRPVRIFKWSLDGRSILYLQDVGGDENYAIFSADLGTGRTRRLIGGGKTRAELIGLSYRYPHDILVGLNDRDPKWHDVWRVNVATGQAARVEKNDSMDYFLADETLALRVAGKSTPDGGSALYKRTGPTWTQFLTIPPDDALTTYPISVSAHGATLWMLDSRNRDKAALVEIDLATGRAEIRGENPQADVAQSLIDPRSRAVLAYSAEYERVRWTAIDPGLAADIAFLDKNIPGTWDILGQSRDNDIWTVRIDTVVEPVKFATYDRVRKKLSPLFVARPTLAGAPLSPMHARVITARDGLKLVSYLTLPRGTDPDGDGRPSNPLPLVLNVHGGPWARASFGYNPDHHWFANRGYAVLTVNYRGSTGFGKSFLNAADREWGGKMHDDLLDAVAWAIKENIAQPDKVAIYGASYGGYAALVGLSFTPKTFACGVSLVGPSNLNTLLASTPPYYASVIEKLKRRVGDHTTPEGRKFLSDRSPLFRAGAIERPLLILHGANDPRVKQAESDQIVEAMKTKNVPVSYVLYSDEGHGLARPANRLSYYAVAESFLGGCLGGRTQPIGEDFKNSSISIVTGREFINGASEALGISKPN